MKTLTRLFILLFVMAGVSSCYTGIPLKQGKSENNRTYEVSYLFEHDGVKVYRFMDMGNYCLLYTSRYSFLQKLYAMAKAHVENCFPV